MKPYRLVEFDKLDSTNLHARARIRDLQDGDVVQARVQTAGRGRGDRVWISDVPGNLCLTCVLKPDGAIAKLPLANLSQLLAVCACRVVAEYHQHAGLKWPNDILAGGRKIGGILAESVTEGSEFLGLALGIGINLNLAPGQVSRIDQPATALNLLHGAEINVAGFRDALLRQFFSRYDEFLARGFPLIRQEYLGRFLHLGSRVSVRAGGEVASGTVAGITTEGALELAEPGGRLRIITIGEMFPA